MFVTREIDNILKGHSSILTLFACFIVFSIAAIDAEAQENPTVNPDSLMSYDLAEIVVSDGSVFKAESNTVQKVTIADIISQNATAVSDLARLIPAAHIQTNSRGESLIYLRNAGERQVALYFNGALLNVPWDNRINLDLVPASVIGGMTVTKGVPSVLYGTNALGGAINMTSRTLDYDGAVTELNVQLGDVSTSNFSATHLFSSGDFKFTGAVGYNSRDGLPLPPVSLFSQSSSSIRANTDREMLNLFGQGSYRLQGGAEVGLSYLFVDGDFGIAPEGHIDPAESSVRFWRYPHYRNSTLVLNSSIPLGETAIMRGALWGSWFEQDINSYASSTYELLEETQHDDDDTYGGRLTVNQQLGEGQLSLAFNALKSRHSEFTREFQEDGTQVSEETAGIERFEQVVYSLGAEYGLPVTEDFRFNIGGSLDGITTPKTGDKPDRDGQTGFGVSGGLQYRLAPTLLLRASTGRKVRFPTMRELFGVALNRFLLNPDLKPESSFVTELALVTEGSQFSGEIIGFFQRTHDTIDQERVNVDGVSLRRRINLDGSRVFGVELVGNARPIRSVSVDGHLTLMKPRALDGDDTSFLTEKPSILGSLTVQHNSPAGFAFLTRASYTGKAYGRDEDNSLVPLVTSVVIDAKASYLFAFGRSDVFTEAFVRMDNIFDVETLPQLGLPGAGRLFSVGLGVTL